MRSRTTIWLTLGVISALAGCKGRQRAMAGGETTATAAPGATDTSAMRGAPSDTGAAANQQLSDANIVALLDEANKADSAAGAAALPKATSADVKGFARLMMSEHHALRVAGQQLAKKLNVTPEPPANDPLAPAAKTEMDTLKATSKGAQFDRVYIEQEIGAHKAVLNLLDQAKAATQNADLKGLI